MNQNPFEPIFRSGRPALIAHRGLSAREPENTVRAFRAATTPDRSGRPPADGVELDVRRTVDGHLVVTHDPTVDGRLVAETAAGDLPPELPSLAEAIDACGDVAVNVEIKHLPVEADFDAERAPARAVASALAARPDADRFLVSSFDDVALEAVRARAPSLATALLVLRLAEDRRPESIAAAGHVALHPHERSVTGQLVARCHAAGLSVTVWTVDEPRRAVELAALGIDGIVTDDPPLLRRALR